MWWRKFFFPSEMVCSPFPVWSRPDSYRSLWQMCLVLLFIFSSGFFCSFVCLLLLFHLGDNALAPKWRGVVTQVIRLLHLGETIMQQSVCTISICKWSKWMNHHTGHIKKENLWAFRNNGKKTHTYRLRGITEPFTPQTFEDKWFVVMETKKNRCLFNTLSYPISRSSVQ